MKNYLKSLFGVVLLICASVSNADGPGWTVSSEVIKIAVVADGGINVRLSPELSGCTSQFGYGAKYASVYVDHPGMKSIQSNLMAAYMSGKKVSLFLSDDKCKVGEMVLGGTYSGGPEF